MTDPKNELHENPSSLPGVVRDRHRALVSLMEELEAVDWYGQRLAAAEDEELKEILAHNRAEEIEHAAMILEWLRRNDEGFEAELRERLFRDGPIVAAAGQPEGEGRSDLGIGRMDPEDRSKGTR